MYIGTTRFNNNTWEELQIFKNEHNISDCIYGFPVRLPDKISLKKNIFIIEMNNDTNKIMGIGIIKNWLYTRPCRIYRDRNYNRYIYRGKPYITRKEMLQLHNNDGKKMVECLENLLFKGYQHLKRGQSVTEFTDIKKYYFEKTTSENMTQYLLTMFEKKYVIK